MQPSMLAAALFAGLKVYFVNGDKVTNLPAQVVASFELLHVANEVDQAEEKKVVVENGNRAVWWRLMHLARRGAVRDRYITESELLTDPQRPASASADEFYKAFVLPMRHMADYLIAQPVILAALMPGGSVIRSAFLYSLDSNLWFALHNNIFFAVGAGIAQRCRFSPTTPKKLVHSAVLLSQISMGLAGVVPDGMPMLRSNLHAFCVGFLPAPVQAMLTFMAGAAFLVDHMALALLCPFLNMLCPNVYHIALAHCSLTAEVAGELVSGVRRMMREAGYVLLAPVYAGDGKLVFMYHERSQRGRCIIMLSTRYFPSKKALAMSWPAPFQALVGVTEDGTFRAYTNELTLACLSSNVVVVGPENWNDASVQNTVMAGAMGLQVVLDNTKCTCELAEAIDEAVAANDGCTNIMGVLALNESLRLAYPYRMPVAALPNALARILNRRVDTAFYPHLFRHTLMPGDLASRLEELEYFDDDLALHNISKVLRNTALAPFFTTAPHHQALDAGWELVSKKDEAL